MPRLITKFKYSKTGKKYRGNLVEYIATREGVEAPSPEQYLKYINYRPRSHGLFSGVGKEIDLKKAIEEVAAHDGKVWTAIFSLKREDAQRLGYDNADSWQKLLDANTDVLAEQMKIPQEDFRWYAAFHNEGHHPHVHMVIFSADPHKGRLSETGIERIRSALAGQIFKQDLTSIYEDQTEMRNRLTEQAREAFLQAIINLQMTPLAQPELSGLMELLSGQLKQAKGKKVYGYLPARTKKTVDEIVDQLGENEQVKAAYQAWYRLRNEVLHTYRDEDEAEKPLSQQKEFRQVKNMVIRELLEAERNPISDREIAPQIEEAEDELTEKADAKELRQLLKKMTTLKREAKDGQAWAMFVLAKEYLKEDSSVYDPESAVYWLKQCAKTGNSLAEYRLAKLYLEGNVLPKNIDTAVRYLQSATEKGNRYAAYLLGKMYAQGTEDVEQNWKAAEPYLNYAAEQGLPFAQWIIDRHNRQQDRREDYSFAFSHLAIAFAEMLEDKQPHLPNQPTMKIDRKRLRELRRKKMAQGHAYNDMEIKF